MVAGTGHAEADIIAYAKTKNLKVESDHGN
jgi:hypothetical protein